MTMLPTREDHLAWAKRRAIDILDSGDTSGAVASMISDLRKWKEPLYDPTALLTLQMDGMLFCKTAAQVKHWIEGFN